MNKLVQYYYGSLFMMYLNREMFEMNKLVQYYYGSLFIMYLNRVIFIVEGADIL